MKHEKQQFLRTGLQASWWSDTWRNEADEAGPQMAALSGDPDWSSEMRRQGGCDLCTTGVKNWNLERPRQTKYTGLSSKGQVDRQTALALCRGCILNFHWVQITSACLWGNDAWLGKEPPARFRKRNLGNHTQPEIFPVLQTQGGKSYHS